MARSPEKVGGRRSGAPATSTSKATPTAPTTPAESTARASLIEATARAHASPPCCGRQLWAIWVGRCPHCDSGHVHRSGMTARLLAGRVVKCCPATGRPYLLRPVRRQREARAVRHAAA